MTAPIAAILLRKEEELVEHFRQQGALSAATAMTPGALAIAEDMTFRRLRDRAVIREGAAGTFYVDEATVAARRQLTKRLRPVLLVIATLLAIIATVLVTLTNGGGAM